MINNARKAQSPDRAFAVTVWKNISLIAEVLLAIIASVYVLPTAMQTKKVIHRDQQPSLNA